MKKLLTKLRTFFRFLISPWTTSREQLNDLQGTTDLLFSQAKGLEAQRIAERLMSLERDALACYVRLGAVETKLRKLPIEEIRSAAATVSRHVSVSADIDTHGESYCIVVGRYQNRDYVRLFPMPQQDLGSLIDMLRSAEKHAHRGRIDVPRGMEAFVPHYMSDDTL